MSIWGFLGLFTTVAGTITGGLIWIAKLSITKFFDAKVEAYKAQLDKEAERYKSELRLNEMRFSRFHEKQCEAVAEIYGQLTKLSNEATDFIMVPHPKAELEPRYKQLNNVLNGFCRSFDDNQILLSPEIYDKLRKYSTSVWKVVAPLKDSFGSKSTDDDISQSIKALIEICSTAEPIRKDLIKEFRQIHRSGEPIVKGSELES